MFAFIYGCSGQDSADDTQSIGTAVDSVSGEYAACAACHGAEGAGNQSMRAPGIANLADWYIERQLVNFREGIRSVDTEHTEAVQMQQLVANLDDAEIRNLAAQIAAFPDVKSELPAAGDRSIGRDYYYHQCGSCHGPAAVGNEILGAPGLAGLSEWYLSSQLEKFRSGKRGQHQADVYGAQMVFMMKKLTNSEELQDIVAYLQDPAAAESH